MALQDLQKFLLDLSEQPGLRTQFKESPDEIMTAAGLTEEEQALVRSGDEKAIRSYLGDEGETCSAIKTTFC